MQILEFIYAFTNKTKQLIEEYEKVKEFIGQGEEKKKRLDDKMVSWVNENFDNLVKINFLFKGSVKKFVLKNIPKLTQAIYDLVRIKIAGVGDNASKI